MILRLARRRIGLYLDNLPGEVVANMPNQVICHFIVY